MRCVSLEHFLSTALLLNLSTPTYPVFASQGIEDAAAHPDVIPNLFISHSHLRRGFKDDRALRVDVEKLELTRNQDGLGGNYELKLWYGKPASALHIHHEGEVEKNLFDVATTGIYWWHNLNSNWNSIVGLKQDYGKEQRSRTWFGAGLLGTTLHDIDVEAVFFWPVDSKACWNWKSATMLSLAIN